MCNCLHQAPGRWAEAHVGEVCAELLDIQLQQLPLMSDSPIERNRTHTEVSKQKKKLFFPHPHAQRLSETAVKTFLLLCIPTIQNP